MEEVNNYGTYFGGVILYFFRGVEQIKVQYETDRTYLKNGNILKRYLLL